MNLGRTIQRICRISPPLLFLSLVGSCCAPSQPRFVSLGDISLISASDDSLSFIVEVTLESTESRDASLVGATYGLNVDGRERGRGSWSGRKHFAPQSYVTLDMPVRVGASDVPFWVDALLNSDTLSMRIPADFVVDTDHGEWSFSMEFSSAVPLEGVLRRWAVSQSFELAPHLESISMPSMGLRSSSMPVEVSLYNSYPFDIDISSMDLELRIGEGTVGSINVERPKRLPAGQRTSIDLEMAVSNLGPVRSTLSSIASRRLTYAISGTVQMSLGQVDVEAPIEKTGTIRASDML